MSESGRDTREALLGAVGGALAGLAPALDSRDALVDLVRDLGWELPPAAELPIDATRVRAVR